MTGSRQYRAAPLSTTPSCVRAAVKGHRSTERSPPLLSALSQSYMPQGWCGMLSHSPQAHLVPPAG